MSYLPSRPDATLMDVFKRWPEARKSLHVFAQLAMRGESAFTEAERELIAAYVSGINQCRFCEATHTKVAAAFGMPAGVTEDAINDIDSADVSQKLRPVLRYVGKLTTSPGDITQQDVDGVYAAGWDETALSQAVFICGYFNLMPRIVTGLGLSSAQDAVDAAARHVVDHGYI